MDKHRRAMYGITAVFVLVQIAVMCALAYRGRPDYIRSVAGTSALQVFFIVGEVRYNLFMSTYVRVLVTLTLFIDALFGYYFDLYVSSVVFDKILHCFGTYAFSLFAYIIVLQLQGNPIDRRVKFIFTVSLGLSLGAFYEILEFITDSIAQPVQPSQPNLLDTDLDLIADLAGAVLAAIHCVSKNFTERGF